MPLRKHSISIRGHRTSFSLEDEFWEQLQEIARSRELPTARLITRIDADRDPEQNLSSALRVFILQEIKRSSTSPSESSS